MIVYENTEEPSLVEKKGSPTRQCSYVIVKNHVKELPSTAQNKSNVQHDKDSSPVCSGGDEPKKKKRKSKQHLEGMTSTDDYFTSTRSTVADYDDIEKLRTAYKKCRRVLRTMESKYTYLLDMSDEDTPDEANQHGLKRKMDTNEKCCCKANKKIVFDDDGRQSTVEASSDDSHICVKKVMNRPNKRQSVERISVQEQEPYAELPDKISELNEMLKNPDLFSTQRNQIINKIKSLRNAYLSDIRFYKPYLIERAKKNPHEVMEFNGANLEDIPGYL